MNKENYESLRKQLDNGSLDIPSQITILEIAYNLEQQLQAYKDKEDKLREYVLLVINEHETGHYNVETVGFAIKEHKNNIENILAILNEGDK